jgi:hypothetical protein
VNDAGERARRGAAEERAYGGGGAPRTDKVLLSEHDRHVVLQDLRPQAEDVLRRPQRLLDARARRIVLGVGAGPPDGRHPGEHRRRIRPPPFLDHLDVLLDEDGDEDGPLHASRGEKGAV